MHTHSRHYIWHYPQFGACARSAVVSVPLVGHIAWAYQKVGCTMYKNLISILVTSYIIWHIQESFRTSIFVCSLSVFCLLVLAVRQTFGFCAIVKTVGVTCRQKIKCDALPFFRRNLYTGKEQFPVIKSRKQHPLKMLCRKNLCAIQNEFNKTYSQ